MAILQAVKKLLIELHEKFHRTHPYKLKLKNSKGHELEQLERKVKWKLIVQSMHLVLNPESRIIKQH